MRFRRAFSLCTLFLLLAPGCARVTRAAMAPARMALAPVAPLLHLEPPPAPPPFATQPFVPQAAQLLIGERLEYTGWWMGIPIGEGTITVTGIEEIQGRKAYHLLGEATSNHFLSRFYPVKDVVHSYVDVEHLYTLRFEKYQREGHYRADEVVEFDQEGGVASYTSLLNGSKKTVDIPRGIVDPLAAFVLCRYQTFKPETSFPVDIYSDEKSYRTTVQMLRFETVEVRRRGTYSCLVAEPIAAFKGILVNRGRVWLYVTNDARRIPILIELRTPWGHVAGVISSASLASRRR